MRRILNISIVLYNTAEDEWRSLLCELLRSTLVNAVYLVDNSPNPLHELPDDRRVHYIFIGRNVGYGAAHNKAIRESVYDEIPFHLVMNSDIQVKTEAIDRLLGVMCSNELIGQLMPRVNDVNGEMQYLCKLLPTPMDLARRLVLGKCADHNTRNARFELRHLDHSRPINAPYLSGCFMLLRTDAVRQAGLFDEQFFMYPEDIDLTRRIHRDYLTLYYPSETIVHAHRKASYHSVKMLWIHVVNMIRYFNKWGWLLDSERRAFNRRVLTETV